jgi:hypothetical protein
MPQVFALQPFDCITLEKPWAFKIFAETKPHVRFVRDILGCKVSTSTDRAVTHPLVFKSRATANEIESKCDRRDLSAHERLAEYKRFNDALCHLPGIKVSLEQVPNIVSAFSVIAVELTLPAGANLRVRATVPKQYTNRTSWMELEYFPKQEDMPIGKLKKVKVGTPYRLHIPYAQTNLKLHAKLVPGLQNFGVLPELNEFILFRDKRAPVIVRCSTHQPYRFFDLSNMREDEPLPEQPVYEVYCLQGLLFKTGRTLTYNHDKHHKMLLSTRNCTLGGWDDPRNDKWERPYKGLLNPLHKVKGPFVP